MNSRRPTVVLFCREFPAPSQTFVVRRFMVLVERGWDVRIVCEHSSAEARTAFQSLDGLYGRVHLLPARGSLADVLREWGPGVLHFEFGHHALDHIGAIPHGLVPVVVGFQGYDICIKGLDRDPGYYDAIWNRADAVNFPSDDLRLRALERGMPPSMHAAITPPLADLDLFRPGSRQHVDAAGSGSRPLRVLSTGRLHWKKGLGYGLRAVKALIDRGLACEFRIVGDGPSRPEVVHAARMLGIEDEVRVVGALPHAGVVDEFRWADVVLVPSVSEGFCLVALEAQAMMVPVVATDAEGLPNTVAHEHTGFVVPKRDDRAMADRLAELAKSPEMRQRFGEAGRRRVLELFAVDRQIERFETLYLEAARRER